jgi:ferric-dicitrate binding protein FerR (iron transport regulator)
MSDEHCIIDTLIFSFLDKSISKQDFAKLKEWANETDEHRKYVSQKIEILFSSSIMNDKNDYGHEAAYIRLLNRIESETRYSNNKKHKMMIMPLWGKIAVAAAIILIVILPLIGFNWGRNMMKNNFSEIVMQAPGGSQLNLKLPDGSFVRLNSGSSISYSQGFGITDRNILLHGEGYFEVKHCEELPFIINTKEISLKDIGTEFLFRNYDSDREASVVLTDGSASVSNEVMASDDIILYAGDRLVINKLSGVMTKYRMDIDKTTIRQMNSLVFENMKIIDIANELSRIYNVKIEVADNIRNKLFYGYFNRKKDDIMKILDAMQSTNQLKYKKTNETYILY